MPPTPIVTFVVYTTMAPVDAAPPRDATVGDATVDDASGEDEADDRDAQTKRLAERVHELEREQQRARREQAQAAERVEELEREVEDVREEQEWAAEQAEAARQRRERTFSVRLGGYIDVGLFWAQGNGAGTRSDFGHRLFPEFAGVVPDSWVFVGDPLSTAVNARGEPADTGDSRAVTFDAIDSKGATTFLVNAVNLMPTATLGEQVSALAMVDFVPRTRDVSDPNGTFVGDFIDVKLAYLRWDVPVRRLDFELYAGKIDPVVGREYRIQESPQRTEVTPSLICRYTCGRPIGIKGRWLLFDRRFVLAASLTNGSSFKETFGFSNEIDRNDVKTAAGRISYELPIGAGLELGTSGQIGAQDLQRRNDLLQWTYGFDAHLDVRGFELTGEFMHGRARGKDSGEDMGRAARCANAPCLRVAGAYVTAGYRALNWLMPFVRVDWRDAYHQQGASFVYLTQTTRLSPGARFELTPNVVLKAQYTVNLEVGDIPQIPNDVFTSSLVGHF